MEKKLSLFCTSLGSLLETRNHPNLQTSQLVEEDEVEKWKKPMSLVVLVSPLTNLELPYRHSPVQKTLTCHSLSRPPANDILGT